jgi:hypothetical protein
LTMPKAASAKARAKNTPVKLPHRWSASHPPPAAIVTRSAAANSGQRRRPAPWEAN